MSMDSIKIKNNLEKIYNLLQERRLKESFVLLKLFSDTLQQWTFSDKLAEMETSYRYMIHYMLDGFQDPKRAQIYNGLILSAYTLADKMTDCLLEKEASTLYYNRRRYRQAQPGFSVEEQFRRAEKSAEALALNQLAPEASDREALLRADEREEAELFLDVWTDYPPSEQDIEWMKTLLVPHTLSDIRLSLVVTAVTLSLLHRYHEQKLVWLLSAYGYPSALVRQRALVGALLVIYRNPDRVRLSSTLCSMLEAMAEDTNLKRDVCNIFMQLIKSRETEKVSRKFTEEILPEMMKLGPSVYGKISQEDLMNDIGALDKNPEWQEILDRSGVGDKLKEMSELQMEGVDVFMSTFSNLKSFPLFQRALQLVPALSRGALLAKAALWRAPVAKYPEKGTRIVCVPVQLRQILLRPYRQPGLRRSAGDDAGAVYPRRFRHERVDERGVRPQIGPPGRNLLEPVHPGPVSFLQTASPQRRV